MEFVGGLLLALLALSIKCSINRYYKEKADELTAIQQAKLENQKAHQPIIHQLQQDVMMGRFQPQYNTWDERAEAIKSECRKRLYAADITPDEWTLYIAFGGKR